MEQIQNKYNLIKLGELVVKNPESAIEWCKNQELLPKERVCQTCHRPMNFVKGLDVFRCWRSGCSSRRYPVAKDTWFDGVQSADIVTKGILITYAWTQNFTYDQAVRESALLATGNVTSINTISDSYSYCRQVFLGFVLYFSPCSNAHWVLASALAYSFNSILFNI